MSQPLPEPLPSFVRKSEFPGMLIFFIVVLGGQYLAYRLQEPVMQHYGLHGGGPGDAPPWYFITRDFAQGICSLGVLLLSLGIAAATWRWWPGYSGIIIWMSLMYQGGNIAQSWIIYQSCPGLLDGQRITSRWPTFHSYLGDPQVAQARTLVLVAGFVLALALSVASSYLQYKKIRRAMQPVDTSHGQEGDEQPSAPAPPSDGTGPP